MFQRVVPVIFVLTGLMLNQMVSADISGKVSDKAGGPIKGATVKLVKNGATATTGADGTYMLTTTGVISR